jgi:hypothetical protein
MNKFRLAVDNQEISGFTLISPFKGHNPIQLNEYIDDGEASEIILENILEYIPSEQILNFFKSLSAKLSHGGTCTIISKDIIILAEAFTRGEISIIDFNKILFGNKTHAWDFRISTITLADINDICKSLGLSILERKITGYDFIIKVQRQ